MTCCKAWETFPYTDRGYGFIHALSHKRIPFTEAYIADLLECDIRAAHVMCDKARHFGWIHRTAFTDRSRKPEGRGISWQGKLPKHR